MNTETATATVAAPIEEIRAVLLDALAFPEWNDAFLSISGPQEAGVDATYALRVRPGLPGRMQYTDIEPQRVSIRWSAPGFTEDGDWELQPAPGGTLVTHTYRQVGPTAALLRTAMQGVTQERLRRLALRVGG
jgi:hypothetical protein